MSTLAKKIIVDFGANRGQNLQYYLLKADVVVAVEANPHLCADLRKKFAQEIKEGRLFVENCVVVERINIEAKPVTFWISNKSDVLSTFVKPQDLENFKTIFVRGRTPASIIRSYLNGEETLLYCKFDLEGYDAPALRSLFSSDIFPSYLSVEIQTKEALSEVLAKKVYKAFMITDGASVMKKYRNTNIKVGESKSTFSFAQHSAGPFGEDLIGRRISSEKLEKLIRFKGYGWRDVHAFKEPIRHPFWNNLWWEVEFLFRRVRRFIWRKILLNSQSLDSKVTLNSTGGVPR